MRKIIIILLAIITIQSINAQARLGESFDEIQKEFLQYGIKPTICDDGLNALSFKIMHSTIIYYFDEYNICTNTLIATLDKKTATDIINHYNKSYILIDDFKWKVVKNLTSVIITSHYDGELGYIFVWHYLEDNYGYKGTLR